MYVKHPQTNAIFCSLYVMACISLVEQRCKCAPNEYFHQPRVRLQPFVFESAAKVSLKTRIQ